MKPCSPIKMIHGIPVLYEDKFLLVVDKPAGIPSQSDQDGTEGVIEKIRKVLPQAALVHRLDRPVGGLLVVARNRKAAAKLSEALREDQFSKDYLAVLWGKPEKEADRLEDFLLRDGHSNTSSVVATAVNATPSPQSAKEQDPLGKKSVLHYRTLSTAVLPTEALYGSKWLGASPFASLFGGPSEPSPETAPASAQNDSNTSDADAPALTLVRIHLETGRHHQIRVQMAHMGCPVLGDRKYGAEHLGKLEPEYRPDMPALYSYKLSLKHPDSGEAMTFLSLPSDGYPFDLFNLTTLLGEDFE